LLVLPPLGCFAPAIGFQNFAGAINGRPVEIDPGLISTYLLSYPGAKCSAG